jgi:hypothetical protein
MGSCRHTFAFRATAQVISIALIPVVVPMVALLSWVHRLELHRIPVPLIICRPSRLIYGTTHLALK